MRTCLTLFTLVLFFLIASCNKKKQTPEPYYFYPDTNRFVLPYSYPYMNGYNKFWYPNSPILYSEGNYENGNPSGYWKFYYPDGRYLREGNFSNGQLSGYWKFYYPDGRMQEEGNYDNNIKTGHWKFYHPNGLKSSEGNFSNGVKQGEWKYYNENGSLYSTIHH